MKKNKDEPHCHNVSCEKLFESSRIIDLLFVIKQLKDVCTVSGELQDIAHLETQTLIGLASIFPSIFYLKCVCGNINAIYSDQYHTKCGENRECKIFDVNTRCAGGKYLYFLKKNAVDFTVEIYILIEISHY